ncbi:hypothetical protein QYE76_000993 [Lolium multiflorum]|uniref:Aminotransferase-like plant mobile domain-containing protein n=1 Tax=Lolium multiflorum TaxID=4521 RepID=A0AAD8RKD0_LOLMU|nr:hypothetical protein QYE76_000993 [Lolium multiflorum]
MNAAALTALVDRWRPETHTFHLRAGEMTPTLQDVSMILGLSIQGEPLCMNTASDGWRRQMEDLIGMAPPAPKDPKERTPAGAPFLWIRIHFGTCPQGANEDTVRTYTRVYLWYMISRTLFPDSGGKLAHWCWLKALTVLEHQWSWGTAALAYLYRAGDDLLSVLFFYSSLLDKEPTWAYLWDNVSEMTSDPKIMYMHYTEELDTLTAEQVDWEPYGTYYHIGAGMADLNPKCLEEARFWRMRCPLICMWLVEYHQLHIVMRQFGLYQECPPQWQDTDHALHRLDRQRQRKITNWPVHHRGHITLFQHCLEAIQNGGHVEIVPHNLAVFNNYLQWFHESTRIELVNHAYDDDILDDPIEFDEVAQSQYGMTARKGRSTSIASSLNFVRSEIQKSARECEVVWDQSHRDEKPIGPMRHFIKIPDDTILSQSISRGKKQAAQSAYQLKPRGKAPARYTLSDYVNRGKKVVIEEDEEPPRRSSLRRMRNDEPLSSEEEEEEQQEQEVQQQEEQRQRTKRMGVRKQPLRRGRRGRRWRLKTRHAVPCKQQGTGSLSPCSLPNFRSLDTQPDLASPSPSPSRRSANASTAGDSPLLRRPPAPRRQIVDRPVTPTPPHPASADLRRAGPTLPAARRPSLASHGEFLARSPLARRGIRVGG